MRLSCRMLLALSAATPFAAYAQSSFIAPDGRNRLPGVTIFCPSGTGVQPCNFGGGGSTGGTFSLSTGGTLVGSSNPLAVSDALLGSAVNSGTLSVGLHGSNTVTLGAGSAAIGSVSVSNLPGTQTVSGAVSQAGSWSVGVASLPPLAAGTNAIGAVSVSNFPAVQSVAGTVGISALPALPAGANAIGSVTVSNLPGTQTVNGAVTVANFPGTQTITGAVAQSGAWTTGVTSLPSLPAGSNAIGTVTVGNLPGTQSVNGTVSVGNFPTTQAITGSVSLTGSNVVTLSSNSVTLAAGSSSIGTVAAISANVPAYLQAVSSGGASTSSSVNAASSCMATNVKTSTGMVYGYSVSNSNTSSVWLRLFAAGTAPSCGSGTPVRRVLVPAGATVNLTSDVGWLFNGGIGFDVTSGGGADTDSTVIGTAGSVLVNIDYK